MPTVTQNVDIEVEVWCSVCGEGVCHETEVHGDHLYVHCRTCKGRIEELEQEVSDLETEVDELKERIAELEGDEE